MKGSTTRSILPTLMVILCWGLAGCDLGFPKDECAMGKRWCEGDDLYTCVEEGHDVMVHNVAEVLFACGSHGGYCDTQNGSAGCVMAEDQCGDGVNSLCIGDYLCECSPDQLPVLAEQQCGSPNPVCSESGTEAGSAFCAASSEPCFEEDVSGCFEGEDGVFEVRLCESGVWVFERRCVEPDTGCEELSDGTAECHP